MIATKQVLVGLLILGAAALGLPTWAQGSVMPSMMGHSDQRVMVRTMMGDGMGQGCGEHMMQSMGAGGARPNQQWKAERGAVLPKDPDRTTMR